MKQKSISDKQLSNNDIKKGKVTNKDNMDIYTEKFPGYNLSIFSWYKLTSMEFSDDFLKCVGKLDEPEKFIKRILYVKLNKSEIKGLDHLADTILCEDFPATDIVAGFEDLMTERTKITTLVMLDISSEYENIIKQLIPYGNILKFGKKRLMMELDYEGRLYFKKHAVSSKTGPASTFTTKVLKIASKK